MENIDALQIDVLGLYQLAGQHTPIQPDAETDLRVANCHRVLEDLISDPEAVYYGVNTGFGDLHNVKIPADKLSELQSNLIKSHACGMGEEVPAPIVDLMLLLKIRNLAMGYSGVQTATVHHLIRLYNAGARPVIYQQGSLGASGDLAPLAHLSLPLIGEGMVDYQGQRWTGEALLSALGLSPLKLGAKEGLALLNGTQFSTAYGVWAIGQGQELLRWADLTAALSWDTYLCREAPLDERLHALRKQQGQIAVAESIREILAGSALKDLPRQGVQDPYAFRCTPQVHGASLDAWHYARQIIEREINAVTDNPTIIPDAGEILSGGNFHAQPVALALDFLAIAIAEIGSISERRTFQLLSGKRGLPAFLIHEPGLHSGLMITQYTAASIVSQNKQLCTPASVDSIVSSNGQEDHVSMAANAATKLYKVIENVRTILAIEWLCAAQALDLRHPARTSQTLEAYWDLYRAKVSFIDRDRIFSEDIRATVAFMRETEV